MRKDKEVSAIIVARKGSKRIKSKSLLKLNGETLIERKIHQLQNCKNIDRNMMDLVETDVVIWTHCTNPLITPSTYDNAISTYFDNLDKYDSLLSVVELKEHLWKDNKPFNYNPYAKRHIPARELPPLYMQDGGIFIQSYANMKNNSYFFGKKPYLFIIPEKEFLDINNWKDYILAKGIIQEEINALKV